MEEEIKKILEENQEKLESISKRVKKIHKKLIWHSIAGYLKILFILGPIIIGIIYLSPLVKEYSQALEPIFQFLKLSPEDNTLNINTLNNLFSAEEIDSEIIKGICDPNLRSEVINEVCQ